MGRISILFFTFFLIANSNDKTMIELESYIAQLVELGEITDGELVSFTQKLEKGELANPIDCNL